MSARQGDKFDLRVKEAVTVGQLQGLITKYKPNIVHFSGHGSKKGELIFEDETGQGVPINTQNLGKLFQLIRNQIICVVLNACYSENQAKEIAKSLPYVIGMNTEITDPAAIGYSVSFYIGVASGLSVKAAHELACTQLSLTHPKEVNTPTLIEGMQAEATQNLLSEHETKMVGNLLDLYSKLLRLTEKAKMVFDNQMIPVEQMIEILERKHNVSWDDFGDTGDMFTKFYPQMNEQEIRQAKFIRELTNDLAGYNTTMFSLLDSNDEMISYCLELKKLYDHLHIWLAKYRSAKNDESMFVIYVGEKEGKRFPVGIEKYIRLKVQELQQKLGLL